MRELCADSGLAPGAFCKRKSLQPTLPGIPLESCRLCGGENRPVLKILSPLPKAYMPSPGRDSVTLKLAAAGALKVSWYLNGRPLEGTPQEYTFPGGARYTLRAVEDPGDPETPVRSAEVTFSVGIP